MLKTFKQKPFTVRAAQFSFLIPIICMAITGYINSNSGDYKELALPFYFGATVLIILAFFAGLIGVFGCFKHKKSETLLPGLLGIILNGGLILLALPGLKSSYERINEINQEVKTGQRSFDRIGVIIANKVNSDCPQNIDEVTRMDKCEAGPDNSFTIFYTLLEIDNNDFDHDLFQSMMKPDILHNYKTDPNLETFRNYRVKMNFSYRDTAGNVLANIVLNPEEYIQ